METMFVIVSRILGDRLCVAVSSTVESVSKIAFLSVGNPLVVGL